MLTSTPRIVDRHGGSGPGSGIQSINADTTSAQQIADQNATRFSTTGGVTIIPSYKNNVSATSNPTNSNDDTQGYSVGSRWFNIRDRTSWVCIDATTGAANWLRELFDISKSGLSSAVDPAVTDDFNSGYKQGSLWFNQLTKKMFICVDTAIGAAVWTQITNIVSAVDPTVNDDNLAGNFVGQYWFNSVSQTSFICTNASNGAAVWLQVGGGSVVTSVSTATYGSTTLMGAGMASLSLTGGSGLAIVNLDTANLPVGTIFTIMDTGLQASVDNYFIDAGAGNSIITNVSSQTVTVVTNGTALTIQLVDPTTWKSI